MIGIAGNAGDDVGIARLHRRAARRSAAIALARQADGVEPAHAEAEMLRQAIALSGADRETGDAKPVNVAGRNFPSRPAL